MRIAKQKQVEKELWQRDRVTIIHAGKTIMIDVDRSNGEVVNWEGATQKDRDKLRRLDMIDQTWDRAVKNFLEKRMR